MNKKHNRLIATARQYALVTFLGLGMSFAVVKAAVKSQKSVTMAEQEWLYDGVGDPTLPGSYSPNDPNEPLSVQCTGSSEVCGIKAPNNGSDHPEISEDLKIKIRSGAADQEELFMRD